MKACHKLAEPAALIAYREVQPEGTWEQLKNDAFHGGKEAYAVVKQALVRSQRGLCAYCERRIAHGLSEAELEASKNEQRVEHFHPKDDLNHALNWALHWPNLLAVCHGGSRKPPIGEPLNAIDYLPPLPENFSCDAYKDHQIKKGKLNASPEGWILSPNEVSAFPRLFQFAPDGTPEPCPDYCAAHVAPNNQHPDTVTLVSQTIEHLNLGCTRLNWRRHIVRAQLEKTIDRIRKNSHGANPRELLLQLARRIFSNEASTPWPEFFTLIRWRLGNPAEEHLHAIGFVG